MSSRGVVAVSINMRALDEAERAELRQSKRPYSSRVCDVLHEYIATYGTDSCEWLGDLLTEGAGTDAQLLRLSERYEATAEDAINSGNSPDLDAVGVVLLLEMCSPQQRKNLAWFWSYWLPIYVEGERVDPVEPEPEEPKPEIVAAASEPMRPATVIRPPIISARKARPSPPPQRLPTSTVLRPPPKQLGPQLTHVFCKAKPGSRAHDRSETCWCNPYVMDVPVTGRIVRHAEFDVVADTA